ncbi:DUF4276 family protein [Solwaraspora sp. WMMD406]|uniref:DUF4276 family protein n=1 Tax=Solwaraspora sp. WMMD406 TaxID=3016095 RepID=UPI002417C29E|nr:DUF4276 family protein [Solwaraspora sp. WMMD406]MDG4767321.1 DUF4276 family protein [Solwaraspora sp. WMMD406]
MRYLSTALLSEGVSDDQFLPNLLGRALTELCEAEFIDQVEVANVQPLRDRPGPSTVDEAIAMVERNDGAFSMIFYHRDQGANPERVRKEWLEPLRKRWTDRREQLVAVVPVRETEAWLLADGQALRDALGVRWTDVEMGLPGSPRQVEQIADPKKVLNDVTRRVSRSVGDYLGQLGDYVDLDKLQQVPAYRRWWDDTREALTALGYRPGR